MAPSLHVSTPAAVWNDTPGTTSLTTASFTPPSGSIVVAKVSAAEGVINFTTPTGLTFTSQANVTDPSDCRVAIFTATGGGGAVTVTAAFSGTGQERGLVVEVWSSAQLAATPATHTLVMAAAGLPSDTITTTGTNSVVTWVGADFQAQDGTSRTYRSSATETAYHRSGGYTGYQAYQAAAAAGSQTYGLTAPASQKMTMASLEIQDAVTTTPQSPVRKMYARARSATR